MALPTFVLAEFAKRRFEDGAIARRDRNRSSIIAWSSGNEVGERYDGDTGKGGHQTSRFLADIIYAEGPTRPVTAGNDQIPAGTNGFQWLSEDCRSVRLQLQTRPPRRVSRRQSRHFA